MRAAAYLGLFDNVDPPAFRHSLQLAGDKWFETAARCRQQQQ